MRWRIFLILLLLSFCTTDRARIQTDFAYPNRLPGYYSGDPIPDKTVYLTFDDGPSDWTGDILDLLKKENIKATFFVCGAWLPKSGRLNNSFVKYRATLLRMRREGHAIGNHSFGHANLARISKDRIVAQMEENEKLFGEALGEEGFKFTLLRPPYGSPYYRKASDESVRRVDSALRGRGIVFMWSKSFDSTDSRDWVRGEWFEKSSRIQAGGEQFLHKMDRIYHRSVADADGKGFVILMHDTHPTTKQILPYIIRKWKSEGYRFETAEDYIRWRWGMSGEEVLLRAFD